MVELMNAMLGSFCAVSALLVVMLHHPTHAAGALAFCTLSTGALLVLHGYPSLGGSVAFVMVISALFLLIVQLTLNVGEAPSRRRLSFRATFSAMGFVFFATALLGTWLPLMPESVAPVAPPTQASTTDAMIWQRMLFTSAHIEVLVLATMALATVLIYFLLIRRRP